MNSLPSLAKIIFSHFSYRQPKRWTEEEFLHVSDLYNECFRKIYLSRKHNIQVDQVVHPTDRLLWDWGKSLENLIHYEMDQADVLEERHPILINKELKLIGTPDGRLKNQMLEDTKAVNPYYFRLTKNAPLPHHKFQMEAYLWMDKSQKGILSYWTWDKIKMPGRDCLVSYNLKVGEVVQKSVTELLNAQNGGSLPRRVCQSQDEKRALLCPVRELCFAAQTRGTTRTIGEILGYK